MNNVHVKRGDTVVVRTGKDKGKIGKILSVNPANHRVQVENVNIIVRHTKPKSAQEAGGRIESAGFIDSSNVMIVCDACSKFTRIAHKFIDNKKIRVCKHCDASLDEQKSDKKSKKAKIDKKDEKTKKVEKASKLDNAKSEDKEIDKPKNKKDDKKEVVKKIESKKEVKETAKK